MIIFVNNLTNKRLAHLFLPFVLISATGIGLFPLDQIIVNLVGSCHIVVLVYPQINHLRTLFPNIKLTSHFDFMMANIISP